MTVYELLASWWRTTVPMIVGAVAAHLTALGIDIDQTAVVGALTVSAGTLYYALIRLAELHLGSGWGWLIGLAQPPSYDRGTGGAPSRHRATGTA